MAYTWGQLKAEIRKTAFPSGESSNLVVAHDKAMVDALIDLQTFVDCLRQDNTTIVPQCSTLYNYGITVLDAPRGRILKVSVIDALPPVEPDGAILLTEDFAPTTTDAESAPVSIGALSATGTYLIQITAASDVYKEKTVKAQFFAVTIQYTDSKNTLQSYTVDVYLDDKTTDQSLSVDIANATPIYVSIKPYNQPPVIFPIAITVNVREPNVTLPPADSNDWNSEIQYGQTDPHYVSSFYLRMKQARYNRFWLPYFFGLAWWDCGLDQPPKIPTGADVPLDLPKLPLGMSYPQPSTNKRRRSITGLWSMERQKISIIPWIQTTESVVIKWDGIKRTWLDTDPIDQDPLLERAVRAYLRKDHYQYWERDYAAFQAAELDYNDARAMLIHECREETRVRGNEPSFARAASMATSGNPGILFFNTQQQAQASCPDGSDDAFGTILAGTVSSPISQADADARALALAQEQAQSNLNCTQPVPTYYNTAQSYTANCAITDGAPLPEGIPATANIAAGVYSSTISQADADAQAQAAAAAQAASNLDCTFWNSEQSHTATCPSGSTGTPVTRTVLAHTISSKISQADAEALAIASATNQANAALVCNITPVIYYSSIQGGIASGICIKTGGVITRTYTTTLGQFTSLISQGDANQKALSYANSVAANLLRQAQLGPQCRPITLGGGSI